MMDLVDRMVGPWLWFLADWSLRWGALLGALATWFALRPPRRAATRHELCVSALAAGVLLPFVPGWGVARLPWPSRAEAAPAPAPSRVQESPTLPRTREAIPGAVPGPAPRIEGEAIDDRPSGARVSRPRSSGTRGVVAAVVGLAWGLMVMALSARWVGGRLVLAGLRRRALGVDEGSGRLLEECRRAVRLSRPVALATHPAVALPAVLGGRKPLILVPRDWDGWPVSDRRACLLHELSHLVRRDDWAKFAQELVRIPVFFHPLVAWLLARLARERELLCDEAVVALGADPVAYARLLLDLARRPGRHLPGPGPIQAGWLPFFDRGTVAVRIDRLLEDDMPRTIEPQPTRRLVALGAAALAVTLVVGGLRIGTVEARPSPGPQAPTPPPKAEPPPRADRILEGTVLGPDGKPVAEAVVVGGSTESASIANRAFRTDGEGRFSWPLPPGEVSVELVAHKDGFAPAHRSLRLKAEIAGDRLLMHLGKSETFRALLVDAVGRPVAGARVRVEALATSSTSDQASGGTITTVYFRMSHALIDGGPLEDLVTATSDDRGAFTFRDSPVGYWLKLVATGPDGRKLRVKAGSTPAGFVGATMEQNGFVFAPPGEPTRLVTSPAARVMGRVSTSLEGVKVSGLKVVYQGSQPNREDPIGPAHSGGTATTDEAGRFSFDGLNEGTINVIVHPRSPDAPWTFRAAKDVPLKSGETAEVTIELIRGVAVEGKVVDRKTGRAVEGAIVGVYGPYRPRSGAMTRSTKTDAEGRYHYRLPSGETYLYVMGPPSGYMTRPDQGSSRTVSIPEGPTSFEAPPLVLDAAVVVSGRVLDSAGMPVVGAVVVGTCEGGRCIPFGGADATTDATGKFRLPPARGNLVAVGGTARLLIRLPDKTEHEATALPTSDGAVTVQLPFLSRAIPGVQGPR